MFQQYSVNEMIEKYQKNNIALGKQALQLYYAQYPLEWSDGQKGISYVIYCWGKLVFPGSVSPSHPQAIKNSGWIGGKLSNTIARPFPCARPHKITTHIPYNPPAAACISDI
jgi:hypothetical protein